MLIREPARTPYDLEFALFGVPVRVHPTFWLMAVILGGMGSNFDPMVVLLVAIAVFVSILWHELGHAFAILYYGERPWITLYGFGGLASHIPSSRSRRADPTVRSVTISLAGPFNQLFLAAAILAILFATGYPPSFSGVLPRLDHTMVDQNWRLAIFVSAMLFINIIWPILNLVPIWPLDGGQVLQALATRANPREGLRVTLVVSICTSIAAAIYVAFELKMLITVIFFAYMAFENYQLLQAQNMRRW